MSDQDSLTKESADTIVKKTPTAAQQVLFWVIVVVATISDLWSKSLVFEWLSQKPYQQYTIIPNVLSFVLRENGGAAFSMMSGKRVFLVAISSVSLIVMVAIFYRGWTKNTFMRITIAMFTAGTIGNLWDRVFNGGFVRDFIDVYISPLNYHWPTFNIADSLMCVSLGMFFIYSTLTKKQ